MNNYKNCWTVYCHTTPSGKRYIGITSKKPEKRWSNGRGYKKFNKFFYKAIEKYKWENIQHNIVSTDLTEKEAKWLENYLICYYWTFVGFNDSKGYNCTLGGDGTVGWKPSEEHKRKIREANKCNKYHKGKHHSEETCKKISESHKGKQYHKGKHHSEETCKKISESHKGKHHSEETREKMSASRKCNHWNRGKHLSPETRKKISEGHIGKPTHNKGKHIVMIDGKRHYE